MDAGFEVVLLAFDDIADGCWFSEVSLVDEGRHLMTVMWCRSFATLYSNVDRVIC